MKNVKADKRSLIRWKIYIDRARMYIGYAQFIMIGFVFLKAFEDTGFGQLIFNNLWISAPILFVLFIIVSLLIGRIDNLLGLREEELRNSAVSNPVTREILENIQEIKTDLALIKQENQSNETP